MSQDIKHNDTNKLEILSKRVEKLERIVEDFMDKWGHGVQEKRKKRDDIWDEMVRVLTAQKRND
tara:strand:+ start:515 stop:706 length:192 start_codon:yes stop_codon:yes gene_type:complete